MTYTYKLARRLARLRTVPALFLPILAACTAGDPTSISPIDNSGDASAEGPVAVSPREVTLEGTQHVLFHAFESLIPGSNQVTSIEWTATGGTITGDGSYTSNATGAFKVVGRRKGNPHNPPDTSVVVVVPQQPSVTAVEVTPATAIVGGGLQQQFTVVGRRSDGTTVPIGVTWAATGGTIDAGGLYTAAHAAGTYKVIATHVTTGLTDTAVVTVPAATVTSITLTPSTAALTAGQVQRFTATAQLSDGMTAPVPVAYAATGGSISVTGYYTAGSTAGSFRVVATAEGGKADTSTVTVTTSTTSSSLLYNADFETGTLPSGATSTPCSNPPTPKRVVVYSGASKPFANAPNPRRGNYALALTTLDTDVNGCGSGSSNPRSGVGSPTIFHPGMEVWEAFSIYIPTGFPSVPHFMMFQEDYGAPYNSPPPNGVWMQNYDGTGNRFYITGNYDGVAKTNVRVWSAPATTGVWHDFLLHRRFATDKTGWIEGWFDGRVIVWSDGSTRLTNQQTMLSGGSNADFALLQYRSAGMFPISAYPNGLTVYMDEARVGTTRDSVELPPSTLASVAP